MPTPFQNVKNSLEVESNEWNKEYYSRTPQLYCKRCMTTLDDFLNTGFVSCSECYTTFYAYLSNFALDIHGRNVHTGKIPSREVAKNNIKKEIAKLIELEKAAAAAHDYPLAYEYQKRREQMEENL